MEYEKTSGRVRASMLAATAAAGLDFTSKEEKTPARFQRFVLRGRPS
jgi:hypothetical protein